MPLLTNAQFQTFSLDVTPIGEWEVAPAFSGAAADKCAKIYMLVATAGDASIFYIGQTAGSMRTRFRNGFAKTARYKYKWARMPGKYRLFVWDVSAHITCESKDMLESIEAELVLGARLADKAWPQHQTGIHFRHRVDGRGRQIAPRLAIEMLGQYYDEMARTQLGGSSGYFEAERDRVVSILTASILPGT